MGTNTRGRKYLGEKIPGGEIPGGENTWGGGGGGDKYSEECGEQIPGGTMVASDKKLLLVNKLY